ncbi:MAG TPA: ATP-binding cassette domain-containing protein, partial [Ramlibacter sp.]|nr:ATP-binding cassette domain-containing protein [Ramlibacter sp.]
AVALASALIGYVLGLSAGRFSILYFGLLTLAVALTAMEIIGRLTGLTGGDQGMAVAQLPSWILQRNLSSRDALGLSLALATTVFLIADFVVNGARGRRWRAVKSHRMASMTLGLVPHRENAQAFALSAAIASVAGAATALAIGYLEPESFNLDAGVMLIAATVIGGIASFWGAILGAAFIVMVPELTRGLRDVSAFSLGFAMVVVLLFVPRGIVPSLAALLRQRGAGASKQAGIAARSADHAEARVASLAADLMPRAQKSLEVEDLEVSFGGLRALHGVSLKLEPGATLGLIGPNGAGKTTLLNVLSGYVEPTSCKSVRLGSSDLRAVPAWRRLRLGFGRSFQHAELFGELTIHEMLLLAASVGRDQTEAGKPDRRDPHEIARLVLQGLQLESVAERYPQELPFGIQKVADIGRILASGASVVALDEPFSGLDQHETRELRAILRGMKAAGVSIVIIDHAVQEVLNVADSVMVLDFGEVIATGTPDEIRRNARVQQAYFGSGSKAQPKPRPATPAGASATQLERGNA